MAIGADLPHDLSTFVIEDALRLDHGFWGCVAEGATFKSLGRRRTPQGRAVITTHRAELQTAESLVNETFFDWRAGRRTEVDAELDAMLEGWRATPDGGDLTVAWPLSRPGRRRGRTTSRSRTS